MPIRPMLGDLELALVQWIDTAEEQILVDHAVPGLEGNFTQRLNRDATRVRLRGVLTGDEAQVALEKLRDKFHAAAPLPFVADIMTATRVQQVLIADLQVQEVAGKPERFVYRLTLNEYIPPPPDETVAVEQVNEQVQEDAAELTTQQIDDVSNALGTLEVQVEVGDVSDYSRIAVLVEGTTSEGAPFSARIEEPIEGTYRLTGLRAGTYTVRVVPR